MDSESDGQITEDLIALVKRVALARARTMGLRSADAEDYVGDAYLAMCLLAKEWDAERNIPLRAWVMLNLQNRMNDIARNRIPGLRYRKNFNEVPTEIDNTIIRSKSDIPEGIDWFVWEAAQDKRDELLLHLLEDGLLSKQQIAAVLGVHPSRVSQLIDGIRRRSIKILRDTP